MTLLLTILAILPIDSALEIPSEVLSPFTRTTMVGVCGLACSPVAVNPIARCDRNGFCTQPVDLAARELVDRIEVNAFYDEAGRLVFDQMLFWRWCDHSERFQLQAWRMIKLGTADKKSIQPAPMTPRYDHARKVWVVHWLDGDIERVITAPVLSESKTQFDPELTEREHLAKENRRDLRRMRVGK